MKLATMTSLMRLECHFSIRVNRTTYTPALSQRSLHNIFGE